MRQREREPLYRKVNTRTRGVVHGGGEYRWARHSKASSQAAENGSMRGSMHANRRNGLDYTPLFRFLLSRVGRDWDKAYKEAAARLDRTEPIFWLVARNEDEKEPSVRVDESSYFSGLFIDADNKLALVNPQLKNEDLIPACACCTHTFNGVRFVRKFAETR